MTQLPKNARCIGSILALMVSASGCVHQYQGLNVHVSAFTAPDVAVRRNTPICFADNPGKGASLEQRSRYRDIVSICSEIATTQGLKVVKYGSDPNCLLTTTGWYAGAGQSFYLGSSASCSSIYGSVFCNSESKNVTYYGKGIQLDFASAKDRETIHEIKATVVTQSPGFLDGTAVALCRAAFADFPEKMTEEMYQSSVDMPMRPTGGR